MKGTVGVIGLGIMGGAMSRNLVEAGWEVLGYEISEERRAEAAAGGVKLAADVAEVARAAPVIMTSLPSPAVVLATAQAIADANVERRIVMEASTLTLEDKLAFAEVITKGGHVPLDCPISGTGAQAQMRDLIIYGSGDTDAQARTKPIWDDIAKETHDLGAFGNGTRMKFVANLLVAIHNVASAEAMALGVKAGLDPHQIVRLIAPGAGGSRIFELRAPMMADERYEPATMKISIWQKDMAIIGKFAKELGVSTPTFSACGPVYDAAMAAGLASLDTAAVFKVISGETGPAPN